MRVHLREGQGIVESDIYDAHGRFMNNLEIQGRLLLPNKDTLPLPFSQTAPGRYEGRFPMQGNGEYLLSLVGKTDAQTVVRPFWWACHTLRNTSVWISITAC